ncbi:MAG: hypothetical protein UZ12_BCD005003120 [Bacteroidetes bacterium OLB12]|nr:MAG: hypothetical protein UZ12_BCD005003120 [Bacteroidetes bacterium OLB12]HNR74321.1 hypothetical protein [Cyclobacteriaceae bacterium]HNU41245.1 hypothetical protein [Cyclobacteriaceae bacterium]
MDFFLDNTRRLFDTLKSFSLWNRLFGWGQIKSQLVEANGELQKLSATATAIKSENTRLENALTLEKAALKNAQDGFNRVHTELEVTKTSQLHQTEKLKELQDKNVALETLNQQYLKRGQELSNELNGLKQKAETLDKNQQELKEENSKLRKEDEFRRNEHSNAMAALREIQRKIQNDREQEITEKNQAEILRIRQLKETWLKHEENIKNRMRAICHRHGIEYVDKVPFKGKPDNTVRINDEYIIFDAKSPAGDDLSNFPSYLKAQAEGAMKYVKEENVRKEVFLVVPTNTLEYLETFEYRLSDYTVYVISRDSLEPMLLTLRRIEEYEFAEQMSPEERENICRVIGKFVHLSKRRIQIDGFFAKQFFELVYRTEADLSKEFLEKVAEFEKSEKLNPPQEKRQKQINLKELETDTEKIQGEAQQKGIDMQDNLLVKEINKLPLYYTTQPDKSQKDLFE